ncbi:MAG: hypothetical protein IKR71_10515 [Bacteroidales bacterium]|nr:hypothetical protein [Bacteroidales bacterium]
MIIDLASFAFGCILEEGTGTPPWGTALGQQKPNYTFAHEGYKELLAGMIYNAVPLKQICLPIGRGGNIVSGVENTNIQLASVFHNVYINGEKINKPFIMIIYKEDSPSHPGRRHLKYSPKISYRQHNGFVCTNEDFLKEVRMKFALSDDACWFVYQIDASLQTELHLSAIFVNKQHSVTYPNSAVRKKEWSKLVDLNILTK